MSLYYSHPQVVLGDIPGHLTLAISISGCPVACKGCHSSFTWKSSYGNILNIEVIDILLLKNKHIDCFLFYGGEWNLKELIPYLEYIKSKNIKTALYSGYEYMISDLTPHLDFYKIGKWDAFKGGLQSKTTNQKLYQLIPEFREIILYKN